MLPYRINCGEAFEVFAMKVIRHKKIREIIARGEVETQEELTAALKEIGIEVTQATVSRDIKEMSLVKIPCGDGRYKYASPQEKAAMQTENRLHRIFHDTVESIDYSENLVVIKTIPGAAGAVAHTIDMTNWEEIIGTVAGDDTIMIIVKPKEAAEIVVERFKVLQEKRKQP